MEQNFTILKCEIDINQFNEPIINLIFVNKDDGQINHADIPYIIDVCRGTVELHKTSIYKVASDFNLKTIETLINEITDLTKFENISLITKMNFLKKFIKLIEANELTFNTKRNLNFFCDALTKEDRKEVEKESKYVMSDMAKIEMNFNKRMLNIL